MSRAPTPNIMESLMKGEEEIKPPSNNYCKQEKDIESNKAIKQESGKEKATFNLSLSTLEVLEDAWIKLRRNVKGGQRITKTLIVEKAIEIALNELEACGEESELHKRLV